jgi:Fe(II)/alpha-ketoglutarate-dependent arginine beta-hydroxylase
MEVLDLNEVEIGEIKTLISSLKQRYGEASNKVFMEKARYYSTKLPERILEFYHELRSNHDHDGISVVKGFPHFKARKTPSSWAYEGSEFPKLEVDFFSVLACSCLGYMFGWSTQQSGKLIHDLIPQKNKGEAQTGYGSTTELVLHTEDSFHQYKAEYVCMYSIRNEQSVPTMVATTYDLGLDEDELEVLFRYDTPLMPDESHLDNLQMAQTSKEKIANESSTFRTLYGNKSNPYICYDPAYTDFSKVSDKFLNAYESLRAEINRNTYDLVIGAGDICIIDNRKVVHGRRAFTPKFDGSARWLKRISVTTNIRKSAGHRSSLDTRVIGL